MSSERVSVGEIARRLGIDQKNLSAHLSPLKTAGLIFDSQRGKYHDYQLTPGRVAYERTDSGGYNLTVFAPGRSGVSVTISAVPIPSAKAQP